MAARERSGDLDFGGETDADLMAYMAMADQDPSAARDAWGEFYRRHVQYLYAMCDRAYGEVLGGEAGAGDIVAETFRRAFRAAGRFDAGAMTRKHHIPDDVLDEAVYRAIHEAGWSIPVDENEVAEAEILQGDGDADLPALLRDPRNVLDGPPDGSATLDCALPSAGSARLDAALARAAREGGRVPPDIEAVMRRDREESEPRRDDHAGEGDADGD